MIETRGWYCTNKICKALNWCFEYNECKIGEEYVDRCYKCGKFHRIYTLGDCIFDVMELKKENDEK